MKEIEQEFLDSGGVWEKETISNLFSVKTSKGIDKGKLQLTDFETDYQFIGRTSVNNGIQGYVKKLDFEPNPKNTFSVVQIGENVMQFRDKEWYASQNLFLLTPKNEELVKNKLFFITLVNSSLKRFGSGYSSYPTLKTLSELEIFIPKINGKNAYKFMENFIAELKALRVAELKALRVAELQAYLQATGLSDYTLTEAEQAALNAIENAKWQIFNVEDLFGNATRGKRLKSADRTAGDLPFVTAGEADTGISAFIGNEVERFNANTITIDMFGSAKYRNYEYGADDHIAVVHTDHLPKHSVLFLTSAMHKVANAGQFSYARNFYAKDADALNIELPMKNGEPDFELMANYLKAIEKLVIKDVIEWSDRNIAATEQVVVG